MTLSHLLTPVPLDDARRAAHNAAVLVDRSDLGVLNITGATRLDLLNRMSTQDLSHLPSGQGAATVLTTDIGRIIDRLLLYADEDAVIAVTGENNGDAVARYLMRYVFFNDDFHIFDAGDQMFVLGVYGPDAADVLAGAGIDASKLVLHAWLTATISGVAVTVHRTDPLNGDGFLVMGAVVARDVVVSQLNAAGAAWISAETFDALRIEAGLPRFGAELTSDYIPLEAGLWDDVSFTKGCYIGQEIIARMESRGRMAKKLVQLHTAATAQAIDAVQAGATVTAGGKKAGTITSAAQVEDALYALAYVKTAALNDADVRLEVNETPLTLVSGLD